MNYQTHILRIIGLVIMIFNMLFITSIAMPPHPLKIKEAQDSGVVIDYTTAKIQEELSRGINKPSVITSVQKSAISGTFRALAVLIEFSDKAQSVPAEDFDTLIFEDRLGTVNNYYKTVSYGNLDIVTVNLPSLIGWITAPQTYSYYVNGERGTGTYPNNTQKLCEDIIALIDASVDFSNYDNDGDGYVDALILVHSGPGYEYTLDANDIHSHKWGISPPQMYDGVNIYEYNIQPEYMNAPGDITCGVYCHELGHVFGLPDLYDTDYSSRGVGLWSIMSTGSWLGRGYDGSRPAEPDAWCRIQLGFSSSVNVVSNLNNVSIASVESGGDIYRVWSSGAITDEYFLVENRQKTDYDSYLPGSGLLIWHIDEAALLNFNPNDNEWYPGYTSSGNYGVALEQADNLYQLEQLVNSGDAGDPFPGSSNATSFSLATSPNSNSYTGANSYVSVSDISVSGSVMTADFQVSLVLDIVNNDNNLIPSKPLLEQNYPNPFNPSTTIMLNIGQIEHLTLNIYDILGRTVKNLVDDEFSTGQVSINWDGTDNSGNKVPSGVYFLEAVTDLESETKKMILVR